MRILDCTLRDGGYVNNWEFDNETAVKIIDGLYESGIRDIEIGILGSGANPKKQTKFNGFDEIKTLLENRKKDCHYYVMFTQENAGNFEFPTCSENTPDSIRIAFFKKTWKDAFDTVIMLKKKGYRVFLQAMATFMYDDNELLEMIDRVNEIEPTAFYIVDSFSTMFPNDITKMRDLVLSRLKKNIGFGFHAHNSIQMAFSNVQTFLNKEFDREIVVDGSIFGMGRGAGNVPIELLMNYFNNSYHTKYDILPILKLFEKHIEPIYKQYGWGYSLPYFLVAKYKTNSAYGWYFNNKGISDLSDLDWCLSQIPDDIRYTLRKDIADSICERLKNGKN